MMTPFERVVGDSSKDHAVTALLSRVSHHGYTTMRDSTGLAPGESIERPFHSCPVPMGAVPADAEAGTRDHAGPLRIITALAPGMKPAEQRLGASPKGEAPNVNARLSGLQAGGPKPITPLACD